MQTEKWYEKYSWWVFVVIALTGLMPAIQLLVSPMSGKTFFAGFGYPVPESILLDASATTFLSFVMRWIGTVLAGGNILTIFIAATAWRKGEKWAWVAMWYWPLMFAAHYLLYGVGFLKNLQILWVVLTLVVLIVNYRRFFSAKNSAGVEQ